MKKNSQSQQIQTPVQSIWRLTRNAVVPAASAAIALAASAPITALAEGTGTTDTEVPATAPVATATASVTAATTAAVPATAAAPAPATTSSATTQTYTATETVLQDSGTFDTEEDAQQFLDDAQEDTDMLAAADPESDYELETTGPEQVETGSHEETTTVDTERTFETEEEAKEYLDDAEAAADESGDTFDSTLTEVPSGTKHRDETQTAKYEETRYSRPFFNKESAIAWAQNQKPTDTDEAVYTITCNVRRGGMPEASIIWATKTTKRFYSTEDEALTALAEAESSDPAARGDYRRVSYSQVSFDGTLYYYEKTDAHKTYISHPIDQEADQHRWYIDYTIMRTPLVPDPSTWKASYTQTHTETVPDYQWAASYKITRTDTYEVPVTPETPTTPTAKQAAATPAPKKSAPTEAATALPQTGDATNPAVPAAFALVGAALIAASHRKRTSDRSE